MASGDLYEVERIVDKRRNKKGKWEYLIRWKGYGSKEDTWEPEHHLLHCEEFIDQFNSLRLHSHKRPKVPKNRQESTFTGHQPATENSRARSEARKKKRTFGPAVGVRVGAVLGIGGGGSGHSQKQKKVGVPPGKHALGDRLSKAMTYKGPLQGGPHLVPPLRVSHNGLQNGEMEPLMYRPAARPHRPSMDRVDGELGDMDNTGQQYTTELGSPLPNGNMHLHSSVKRKLGEEKGYVFDKRLRYNVRQNESNCRFRDIVVRKEEGFTHVLLSSQTTDNNALTPEIMKEVCRALGNAAADDSKLLLLSSVGTVFCSGLEPSYLIGRLSTDRRKESGRIADAVRDFVLAFIHFKKPIVVAINGPALGLGASILPLCDVVWASERAWFQTPCAALHLTPSGCSSYTFPQILGVALANEMLFCGRKLTAQEACSRGLVSQVFWPTTFNQEVMLRVKEMASCNAVVLEESKCLVRSIIMSVLEEVNEKECQMLKQLWCSTKGLEALFSYLHNKTYEK
ncbi:chromodomain Y-like protein 2 [Notolabrus celidotus]|uniref:chromodomain Y-like protein 2 n=1 Tax=Notolabrus celidotus TaxID=1203425 RepID=UPI00148FA2B4|nr:chromodomain Y-like protein 2 [Notolabrus celidotus]XP_034536399.1 chromodomain Y-like protein 2 [Notolabrus celidotus]